MVHVEVTPGPSLSASGLLLIALEKGVAFIPGAAFYLHDGDDSTLRLSFVTATVPEIDIAIAALAQVVRGVSNTKLWLRQAQGDCSPGTTLRSPKDRRSACDRQQLRLLHQSTVLANHGDVNETRAVVSPWSKVDDVLPEVVGLQTFECIDQTFTAQISASTTQPFHHEAR